jgi:LacI family transcriptional regulator
MNKKEMPKKRGIVTLRDVAEAAKVSPMTVSNVVNRRFNIVSAETRERVERAVLRLKYRPHLSARGLRLAVGWSIGVLIVSDDPLHIADPFVTQSIIGLSNRLQEDGYALVVQSLKTYELEHSTLVRSVLTDGTCLVLTGADAQRRQGLELLCSLRQPVILFQDRNIGRHTDMCLIHQDDFGGAVDLATRVLGRDARRIVVLVPSIVSPGFQERERGFRAAVGAHADATLAVVHCGDGSFKAAQLAAQEYIKRYGMPDAFLGGNDQLGIAAIQMLAEMGVRVPDDVAVTGFNAFEIWQYSVPTLTTVESPAYQMGEQAAAEMVHRLQVGRFRQSEILFPVRLRIGGSA